MASITSTVLIGNSHTSNDGIIPTHYIFLSENSRPALILSKINIDDNKDQDKIIWIPTLDNLLEDILLMISINIFRDEELNKKFYSFLDNKKSNDIELGQFPKDALLDLYGKNKGYLDTNKNFKITISVFDGSTLERQLKKLKKYGMGVEICRTSYMRQYLEWQDKLYKKGNL